MTNSMEGIHPVVGVYASRADADTAVGALHRRGIRTDSIVRLAPGGSGSDAVPTTDAEQPEMGTAIGGVVGLSGGLFVASLLVPGLGPVSAIGTAAAALFGLGGAVAGAAVGSELESSLDTGIPRDELMVYEDALRQGRSVVIVDARTEDDARAAHDVFAETGAESIDAARDQWWIGLRDADQELYTPGDPEVATNESAYRRGFETALRSAASGRSVDTMAAELRRETAGEVSGIRPSAAGSSAARRTSTAGPAGGAPARADDARRLVSSDPGD